MKIRCSQAPRTARCPASFMRVASAISMFGPEPANDAMLRGSDIHQQMADILYTHGIQGLFDANRDLDLDTTVRILCSRAASTISQLGMTNAKYIHCEKHLPCEQSIPNVPAGFDWEGTADVIICDHEKNRILVLDYKSGFAAQEPAYENSQIVAYACLAYFSAAELFGMDKDRPVEVFGQIIPAAGKMYAPLLVDENNVDSAVTQMIDIAKEANDGRSEPEPGSHCAWCYAAGRTCEMFNGTVHEAVVTATGISLPTVSDDVLAKAYAMAKKLATLSDSLNAEIKRRVLERGGPVAGYDIKLRRPTVKLAGSALIEACAEFGISADDLGIAVNIKDIGDIVAKKLKVKKVDGLSIVEQKYLQRAIVGEASQVLDYSNED